MSYLQMIVDKEHPPEPLHLPEKWIIKLKGSMIFLLMPDGTRLYSIRDWVFHVSGSKNKQRFAAWKDLKRVLLAEEIKAARSEENNDNAAQSEENNDNKENFKVSEIITVLPVGTIGGEQMMDFTDEEGLYQITQRMSDRSKAVRDVKTYLAKAGVFMGDAYVNPEATAEALDNVAYNRAYNKLLAEGFLPDEAKEWLDVRFGSKKQRRIITAIWNVRGINKPKDFADLTNQIHRVALGLTATRHKRQLAVKDTPRNYISAADNATIQITEFTSGLLHEHRNSLGKPELSEDIDDVRPIMDAARPEIQKTFSQKPRRLGDGKKPQLPK